MTTISYLSLVLSKVTEEVSQDGDQLFLAASGLWELQLGLDHSGEYAIDWERSRYLLLW